jgi:pre-mRNA-splicing factor CWC22
MNIVDETGTRDVKLRRTIYLTIMSSLDFEECAHKLLKSNLEAGKEVRMQPIVLSSFSRLY